MCFRLQIHSQWMMKTHWRAQSQLRTHSVRRSDTRTPRTKQVDSGQESLRINIQKHCIHRRATIWVRRSNAARHSTALDNHRVLFRHSVHVYVHWSNGSLDKTDQLQALCPQKTYLSQINFVVVRTYICTLYFCEVLCCLCFYIVLTFGVIHKLIATIIKFTAILSFIFSVNENHGIMSRPV